MSRRNIFLGVLCVLLGAKVGVAQGAATAPATQAGNALTQPTLITLHVQDADPNLVLAELASQAKSDIVLWPPGMWTRKQGNTVPFVSLDIDNQPFWAAMVEFCNASNVQVQSMGRGRQITLMQGAGSFSAPHCFSGAFAIFVQSAQRGRSIQYNSGRGARPGQVEKNDMLSLEIYVDPRARLVSFDGIQLTEAVDDQGTSLIDPKAYNGRGRGGMPQHGCSFGEGVPLKFADDGYSKLARLKGNMFVAMATKTETLEIADFENSAQKSVSAAGVSVLVKSVKLEGQQLEYTLVITQDAKQSTLAGGLFNNAEDIRIVDADGHPLSRGGGGGGGSDRRLEFSYTLNSSEAITTPLKLVWEMPTETRQETIPFEFSDLPLPTP